MLLFAAALVPPVFVSMAARDGELLNFVTVMCAVLALGLVLRFLGSRRPVSLRVRDGFFVVVVIWLLSSLLGSILFITNLHMHPVDALFESVSALTTTGATVITGLDQLPPTILFFRQELQWLGGIGVVVSAIALMPMLGVGGMQLFRAEAPGPVKDEKLAPRIAHTAVILWKIYLGLTLACAAAYWFAGMTPFDAIAHSFSTVSTGGFSTHDASLGFFDNPTIEGVAVVFMLLGSVNFAVHFAAWRHLDVDRYRENEEVRSFFKLVVVAVVFVAAVLFLVETPGSAKHDVRLALFTVSSVVTSTGFGIDDFSQWGGALPILLILISFVGGCGGSTAGGMKVVRFLVLIKAAVQEIRQLIHPGVVRPVRLQQQRIDPQTIEGVRVFFTVYTALFFLLMLTLMGMGLDLETAFSAIATAMNNLGPGLGDISANFQSIPAAGKLTVALAMLLGRLEIFSLLVLFSPRFWTT
jgi:trk system potassium uptake protein TrkH